MSSCLLRNKKRIRIHDLRHSHVSLLIDMGFSTVAIAERMSHESSDITFRYTHLFPNIQDDMANELDNERGGFWCPAPTTDAIAPYRKRSA